MFDSEVNLIRFMTDHGVNRVIYKCLTENDNCKQQIYLGGNFEAINQIPFSEVTPDNINGRQPNFKAGLEFFWIGNEGQIESAPGAQLILYPRYPEVRLSGVLRNCSIAPREYLKPVPRGERQYNNGKDGRVIVFGICENGHVLAYLSPSGTRLSDELIASSDDNNIFSVIEILTHLASKDVILARIQRIQERGWISGRRMNAQGEIIRYNAINAGGYTLEACFGVIPNGRSEPDWKGWEVKSYNRNRITLMTPEPNSGYYSEHRVGNFVRRYGRVRINGDIYFTGIHKCGFRNPRTGMTMVLDGYNSVSNCIQDVTGGLTLYNANDEPAAVWTFSKLIEHWGRKHAHAVYVPYLKRSSHETIYYRYINPVLIGEGANFNNFLQAFNRGIILYDPASKVYVNEKGNYQIKARNQFRMKISDVNVLYDNFSAVTLPLR